MLSRKQATLRANELLKSAREERERGAVRSTRFLVFIFPELATFAASKRRSAVQAAREQAKKRKHVVVANVAMLVPGIAWVAVWAMDWRGSSALLGIALCTMIGARLVEHFQTRIELRRVLRSRTPPIHDLDAGR